MAEKDKILEVPKPAQKCKICGKPITRAEDHCECRPYLCYHCCECDMDCDLCNCKHKK